MHCGFCKRLIDASVISRFIVAVADVVVVVVVVAAAAVVVVVVVIALTNLVHNFTIFELRCGH